MTTSAKTSLQTECARPSSCYYTESKIFVIISKIMNFYEKCHRTLFARHKILYKNVLRNFYVNCNVIEKIVRVTEIVETIIN